MVRGDETLPLVEYPVPLHSDRQSPIKIFPNEDTSRPSDELHFALSTNGSDALCLKNKAGAVLTYREVSKYLLKPLLR